MPTIIRLGSKGFDVQVAQGILDIYADGIFGPKTEKAVRDFQKKITTLGIDGIVGQRTWPELFKHAAATRKRFADDRRRGQVHYNVWLIPQMKDKACWYASALMVRFWRRQLKQMCEVGQPDPSEVPAAVLLYKNNNVLPWTKIVTFARLMGLKTAPRGPITMAPAFIHDLLERKGPLWVPVEWTGGGGHVIVITGISRDGSTVFINDPGPVGRGKKDKKDLIWLNKHVCTAQDRPILTH